MVRRRRGDEGSKTLHIEKNPPILNWRCLLTQVDRYGRKTVVLVVLNKSKVDFSVLF